MKYKELHKMEFVTLNGFKSLQEEFISFGYTGDVH